MMPAHRRSLAKFCLAAILVVTVPERYLVAELPPNRMGPDSIRQTVDRLADLVQENYFDPVLAAHTADTLRTRHSTGTYDDANTLESLADRLTRDLFDMTSDKHLVIAVKAAEVDHSKSAKSDNSAGSERGRSDNFGIQRVEILAGNVGYLNLTAFYRPEEASDAIATAMHLLRHADALIVDLRVHAGGSPDTTAMFASYFFDDSGRPLFKIVDRSGDARAYATQRDAPADRNRSRPTFLLISKRTFSAGEGIAFLLQENGRAEVVGETTAGAANPGRPYDINPRLEVTIPNGRVVSAIRGGNWEGSGVKPDVTTSATDARHVAHARALAELIRGTSDAKRRESLEQFRAAIQHGD